MKKIIAVVLVPVLIAFAGCQKREPARQIPKERQEMGRKLILKSLQDLENKDLKSAINSLEASIKVDPVDPEAYLLMAQILLKVGEYDRAVEFLDSTAKIFPNNGTVFYMFSIANKAAGKKLPAVLSARRSAEIFQETKDKENFLKAAVLLQDLINTPDDQFAPASQAGGQPAEAAEAQKK